jgi:hypothetical protein
MCRPERYEKMIPLVVKYKANMIALMWGTGWSSQR